MTKKDITLLASRYTQILNEGIFDRFKKKPQETENDNKQYQGVLNKSEETIAVNIFGVKTQMNYRSLMRDSELVETIGQEPNFVELRIYKTSQYDSGSRDQDIFIPVVVIHSEDDYPRPRAFIANVGSGVETRESAMQQLTKLGAKYQEKRNNS